MKRKTLHFLQALIAKWKALMVKKDTEDESLFVGEQVDSGADSDEYKGPSEGHSDSDVEVPSTALQQKNVATEQHQSS